MLRSVPCGVCHGSCPLNRPTNIGASWRVTNEPTSGRCLSMEVVTSSSVSNGSRCYALCQKNQCSKTNERLGRILTDGQKVCANRGEHTIFGFRVAHVASCTTISRKIPFLSASWFASSLSSAVREGLLQLGRVFKVLILAFTIYETNFHWFNLVSHCRELNTNDAGHTQTVYSIPRVSDFTHCDPSDSHFALSRGRRSRGQVAIPG
ncbi:hypothetical protein B0H14DRAFT_967486 [Mycena olivaceomarginata]|nr:hypothetical protein B0H14DRAFT_967486 [Mycena olivaceomarginata]